MCVIAVEISLRGRETDLFVSSERTWNLDNLAVGA
jgi:hypothetical protein